ncbi:thioesterase family protein [Bacillaceae bacterium S4-13-58]
MVVNETTIKVRYAETDQMQVVYHANYLVWFEIGRTALIEQLGFRYADMEKEGVVSPVVHADVAFKTPVRYGETATIRTSISSYTGVRVIYSYEIFNEKGELSVQGKTEHVCVEQKSFRPISIKKRFPDWHQAYEEAQIKES